MEDSLLPLSITQNLTTRIVGREVICYPTVTSTNELAKDAARRGALEGTVIIAEEQTAGRGRRRRSWLTPRGGIALSVVLYPSQDNLPSLIMVASLAVVRSITAVTSLRPQIKWPNDVLIGDRKVCGILVESEVRGDKVEYAIIGIGANVNLERAGLAKLAPEATSLAAELGREVVIPDLVRKLLSETDGLYLSLRSGDSVYEAWRDNLVTLGREVRVDSGGAEEIGIAEAVARDGSLLLRHQDGSLRRVVAGDVSLRRR